MRHPRRIAPLAFCTLLLALVAAGCGADDPAPVSTAATPAPSAAPASDGLKLDTEEEYHQPPDPATGEIGDTITLTGTNLGVRLDVTVTRVDAGDRRTTVGVRLVNTGIAIFESHLTSAVLVDGEGQRARVTAGAKAACSNGLDRVIRLDVGDKRSGCLVFAPIRPKRLQLALEQVPPAAGGRWFLR